MGRVVQWTTEWPAATKSLFIDGTQTAELTAGSYSEVRVQPNGTLTVNPGVYYIQKLVVEKDGKVVVNGNGSAVVLYVKDSLEARGQMIHSQSSEDLLIAYGGYGTVDLDAPFGGTVVAPNAQVRLAPLNGAIHEGSFVGRTLNAEANNEIVLKPFAHWDYLLGMDACTPAVSFVDCTGIATWQQKEYITGDRVTDGLRVYTVHDDATRTLAGTSPDFAPATGLRWQEAWSVSGTCDENGEAKEVLSWFNPSDIAFYYSFDSILHGDTANYIEDIDNTKAEVVGSDALIRYNTTRRGCTSDSAVALNTELVDGYLPGGEITSVQFTKPVDTTSLGIFLELKPYTTNSQTFITNSNSAGTQLAIGYSDQSGLFVKLGAGGETHYAGKDKSSDFTMGEWHNIGVAIVDNGDGTSTIQMVIDSTPLFGSDTEDGITVTGSLNITEDSQWVIGAYNDTALGTLHTPLTGEIGAVLAVKNFPKAGSRVPLTKALDVSMPGEITMSDDAASVQNDVSSVGKEASINTNAPEIPMPDPMAGLKEIEIPKINPLGSANVYYPIEVPKAVVGPTPSLGLRYDSSKKDGNAGIGWNLVASRIEFDTSEDGVQRNYLYIDKITNLTLDGQKLVYWKKEDGVHLFREKVEKEFLVVKFESFSQPLEVSYPDGRHCFYGSNEYSKVNAGSGYKIVRWYLSEEVDANGNKVEFFYEGGLSPDETLRLEPQLSAIRYGFDQRYTISFYWEDKDDYRTDGRGGFLIMDNKQLEGVVIRHGNEIMKKYLLEYDNAAFYGSVLSEISELTGNDETLHQFEFEYTDVEYENDDVEAEFGYFGEADGEVFPSWRNRNIVSEYDIDGNEYSSAVWDSGPMDWNGDGALDYVYVMRDDEQLFPLINDGTSVSSDKLLPSEYILNENDNEACRLPFELAGAEMSDLDVAQVLKEDQRKVEIGLDEHQNKYGWNFEKSSLLDFNGDGFIDVLHACSGNLYVLFNHKGVLANKFEVFPLTDSFEGLLVFDKPVTSGTKYKDDYSDGRKLSNIYVESSALEIVQTEEIRDSICRDGPEEGEGVCESWVNTQSYTYAKLIDMDGDGDLDRVMCRPSYDPWARLDTCDIWVQQNYGAKEGFTIVTDHYGEIDGLEALEIAIGPGMYSTPFKDDEWYSHRVDQHLCDINGDGLPDILTGGLFWLKWRKDHEIPDSSYTPVVAILNYGTYEGDEYNVKYWLGKSSFGYAEQYEDPEGYYGPMPHKRVQLRDMRDMNGDMLPDAIYIGDSGLWVKINNGNRFLDAEKWIAFHAPESGKEIPFLGLSYTLVDKSDSDMTVKTTHHESFLRDCNGDGVPDFVVPASPSEIFTERRCRINKTGRLNRLRKIRNVETGRKIELGYTDGVRLHSGPTDLNARKRTVLSSVEVSNTLVAQAPVEVWEYSYADGFQDERNRDFLGWEKLESRKYIKSEQDNRPNYIDRKEFEFSALHSPDEWGFNAKPLDYFNGTLLLHETGVEQAGAYKTLSRIEYEYDAVPTLDTGNECQFTWAKNIFTSRFDDTGQCLYGEGANGKCLKRETTIKNLEMNTSFGYIEQEYISEQGDPDVAYDDTYEVAYYSRIGSSNMVRRRLQRKTHNSQLIEFSSFDYDDNGNLTTETKWDNRGTERTDDDIDLVTTYEYEPQNSLLFNETNAAGQSIKYDHKFDVQTPSGLVAYQKTTILPDESTQKELYDYNNNLVRTTTNDGVSEFFRYDDWGRLTHSGNHISETFNVVHQYFTNNSGMRKFFGVRTVGVQDDHDELIDMVQMVDAAGMGGQTKKRALVDGQEKWIVSGKVTYDNQGRVHQQGKPVAVDSSLPAEQYASIEMIEPVTYEYDEQNRVTLKTDSDGYFQRFIRQTVSGLSDLSVPENEIELVQTLFVKEVVDQSNSISRAYTDIHGNALVQYSIGADAAKLSTQRRILSPVEQEIIDHQGKVSHHKRDSLGRLSSITTPDAGTNSYYYNEAGKLASVIRHGRVNNSEPIEIIYDYDEYGRIKGVDTADDSRDIKFSYCSIDADVWNRNKVCKVEVGIHATDEDNYTSDLQTNFEYGKGYVVKQRALSVFPRWGGGGNIYPNARMTYSFDAYGRTKQVKYPDNEEVNYHYDIAGRLIRVEGEELYVADILYDEQGRRKSVTSGNGIEREYHYEPASGQLSNMSVHANGSDSTNEALLNMSYFYDNRRLLERLTDASSFAEGGFNLDYTYDSFGRIRSASGEDSAGDWNQNNTYYFDAGTRMAESSQSGVTRTTTFVSGTSAPETVSIPANTDGIQVTKAYSYNDLGELTVVDTYEDGVLAINRSREFVFNSDGTLASAHTQEADLTFLYDSQGGRVYKKAVLSGNIIDETLYLFNLYSMKGGLNSKHISDGRYVVATRLQGYKEKLMFFTPDHLGSTIMVTDETGGVIKKSLYDPFGNPVYDRSFGDNADENERWFTNQIFDKELGLYYFNARYYDPETGVFISPDPAMDGLNHYAYANGNPLLFSDPSGNGAALAFLIAPAIGFAIGATGGALSAVLAGGDASAIARSALIGGIAGALSSVDPVLIGINPVFLGAVTSGFGNYAIQVWGMKRDKIDPVSIAISVIAGSVGSAVGGAMAGEFNGATDLVQSGFGAFVGGVGAGVADAYSQAGWDDFKERNGFEIYLTNDQKDDAEQYLASATRDFHAMERKEKEAKDAFSYIVQQTGMVGISKSYFDNLPSIDTMW
ncbi:MAG: hypothetical protein JXX14_08650 [Deltaproteobacteria bacterium]|nr:hypothetical protein [Deltaproteobacteria bacterium]